MKLTKEKMKSLVEKFMCIYREDKNSRYRSYDYARRVFLENRRKVDDSQAMDLVALNLFAFLGSWGMVCRGNVLMQKDYKFLIPVVQTLYRYDCLCDMDPLAENFDEHKFIETTLKAVADLQEHFKGVEYYKLEGNPLQKSEITDTVIGKILMVTLGCLPAYDTYVKIGLKAEDVCGTLGERSFKDLLDYCKKNECLKDILYDVNEQVKAVMKEDYKEYPVMKLVDMITWEYGYELDAVKKKNA